MARNRLRLRLFTFISAVNESRQLAADAYAWTSPGPGGNSPRISKRRRNSMLELAFLRAFLAWEIFLEETFLLYLMGQKPPRGRGPKRYTFPPNLQTAGEWIIPERRQYAEWTNCQDVCRRAERFFQKGRPYADVLRSRQNIFDESKRIRNAIVHTSGSAQNEFETLIRYKLGVLPPNTTVGSFLCTVKPDSSPPQSFLEHYLGKIEFVAKTIVPTR